MIARSMMNGARQQIAMARRSMTTTAGSGVFLVMGANGGIGSALCERILKGDSTVSPVTSPLGCTTRREATLSSLLLHSSLPASSFTTGTASCHMPYR